MTGRTLIIAAITGVALGLGATAHAEQARPLGASVRDATAPDLNTWGPQLGRRSLQWDSQKARWGLKLDLDTQVGNPLSYKDRDVQAGAFYKITPSFRVGGSFSLGAMSDSKQQVIPADKAPRVRLETALKF